MIRRTALVLLSLSVPIGGCTPHPATPTNPGVQVDGYWMTRIEGIDRMIPAGDGRNAWGWNQRPTEATTGLYKIDAFGRLENRGSPLLPGHQINSVRPTLDEGQARAWVDSWKGRQPVLSRVDASGETITYELKDATHSDLLWRANRIVPFAGGRAWAIGGYQELGDREQSGLTFFDDHGGTHLKLQHWRIDSIILGPGRKRGWAIGGFSPVVIDHEGKASVCKIPQGMRFGSIVPALDGVHAWIIGDASQGQPPDGGVFLVGPDGEAFRYKGIDGVEVIWNAGIGETTGFFSGGAGAFVIDSPGGTLHFLGVDRSNRKFPELPHVASYRTATPDYGGMRHVTPLTPNTRDPACVVAESTMLDARALPVASSLHVVSSDGKVISVRLPHGWVGDIIDSMDGVHAWVIPGVRSPHSLYLLDIRAGVRTFPEIDVLTAGLTNEVPPTIYLGPAGRFGAWIAIPSSTEDLRQRVVLVGFDGKVEEYPALRGDAAGRIPGVG